MAQKATWPPEGTSWHIFYNRTKSPITEEKTCLVCKKTFQKIQSCKRCAKPLCSEACSLKDIHKDMCSFEALPFSLTVWCQQPGCSRRVTECCKTCGIYLSCDNKEHQKPSPLHDIQCPIAASLLSTSPPPKNLAPKFQKFSQLFEKLLTQVDTQERDTILRDVVRKCMDLMEFLYNKPIEPSKLHELFPFVPLEDCGSIAPGLSDLFIVQSSYFAKALTILMEIFPKTQICSIGIGTGGLEKLAQCVRDFLDKDTDIPGFVERGKKDVFCDPNPSPMYRKQVLKPTDPYLKDAIERLKENFAMMIIGSDPKGTYDMEAFQYALRTAHAILAQIEIQGHSVGSTEFREMIQKRQFPSSWRIQYIGETTIKPSKKSLPYQVFQLYLFVNTEKCKKLPKPVQENTAVYRTMNPFYPLQTHIAQVWGDPKSDGQHPVRLIQIFSELMHCFKDMAYNR